MVDMSVPFYRVLMMCKDVSGAIERPLPKGFRFVMCRPCYEDALAWAELEVSVGELKTMDDAMMVFSKDFGAYPEEISRRMVFAENEEGRKIGTSTSWYGILNGIRLPRMHFVSIHPEYQGKGIAKPMILKCMKIFEEIGEAQNVFLSSSTRNHRAIGIYQSLGFEPYNCNPCDYYNFSVKVKNDSIAWRIIEEKNREYRLSINKGKTAHKVLNGVIK